jgi:ketosteroid isomerase-like protein
VKLHPNIAIVRTFYHAFISRDTTTLWKLAGEDLAFHVPGRSPWAGTHRGREQLLQLFHRVGQAAERSLVLHLHDIVGGDVHVVGLHRATASLHGKKLDLNGTAVFHVKDRVIEEAWLAWESQRAFDEFWS